MFQQAWDNIVAIFQGIGEFFGGLWDNVTGILSGIEIWSKVHGIISQAYLVE